MSMKKINLIKTAVAVALLFAVNIDANAQFGGLKGLANKAKKAVTDKAEEKINNKVKEKTNDVVSASAQKVAEAKFGAAPELPQLMNKNITKNSEMKELVYGLRFKTVEEAKALAAKLSARAKWNRSVIKAMQSEIVPKDYTLMDELEGQLENWDYFYGELMQMITLHNSNDMKKDEKGWYSTGNSFMIACMKNGGAADKGLENIKMTVLFMRVNGKGQFVDSGSQPKVLEDDVVEAAKRDYNMLLNAAWLLEGYPIEYCRETENGSMKDSYEKDYQRALAYVLLMNEAIANNSVDNLVFKPMPQAGSLNAQLNAAALKIAKQQDNSTVSVVITRSAWDVKKNPLGVPICRVAYGYRIVQTKHGKRAVSCSWAQDHQGGGKYGALRHYGVGTESYYVK